MYYADEFRAWFQSKSNSCAYATKIVVDEMVRLRNETASQADVDNTVQLYVESFPQHFSRK